MALAGVYNFDKTENFIEYLLGLGLTEEKAKAYNTSFSTLTIKVNGQEITLSRKAHGDSVFTLGKEFDDVLPEGTVLKSTATLAGNVLTVKSTSPLGKTGEKIYTFSDAGLVVAVTGNFTSVVAKIYYKRA